MSLALFIALRHRGEYIIYAYAQGMANFRGLSTHGRSSTQLIGIPCACAIGVVGEDSLCSHFLADHTTLSITVEQCVDIISQGLENCSEEIYCHGKALNQIFRDIWN